MLEQLFHDKDSLSVLLQEIVEKNIDRELLKTKGTGIVTDHNWFLRTVNSILKGRYEKKKAEKLYKFLSQYDENSLSQIDFPPDIRTQIDNIIGNQDISRQLSTNSIVEDLFSQPVETIANEKNKFEPKATDEPIKLRFRAVKGIPYGLWGLLAGVCIGSDVELWKKKEFYLLAMIDEQSQQAVGFIHLFEQTIDGKKVLTVPGIEPSVEFLGQVSAKEIYPLIVEALREVAHKAGYTAIYLPTSENILSNRSDITTLVKKNNYQVEDIPTVNWNTVPDPYPFSNVYVLPLVEPTKDAQVSSSALTTRSASAPTTADKPDNLGGIDMNQKNLDLETSGEEIKFDRPFDPVQLENIKIDGFTPVILQIAPTNLPLLLGTQTADKPMKISRL